MFLRTLVFLICISLHGFSLAEQKKSFADYDVHYSVLNSTFISPKVAQHYGIVRGRDRALINIAIRKNLPGGTDKAQRAIVTGSSSDLIHSQQLNFNEVVENNAVYYIAELRFRHKEMRTFTIKLQPDPNIAPYTLKFSKTLYMDK